MPPPVTPSPFRPSRRYPPSRRSGPQFANSPRFLLSQSTPHRGDIDIVDDETALLSTASPTNDVVVQLISSTTQSRRQRESIDDSEDDKWLDNVDPREKGESGLATDQIESSPPFNSQTPGYDDARDAGTRFASAGDGNKRVRLSMQGVPPPASVGDDLDGAPSPSPEVQVPIPHAMRTPGPRIPQRPAVTQDGSVGGLRATPDTHGRPRPPVVETPGNNTQTPFRNRPRFMLSSQKPRSSQPVLLAESPSATQSSSLERRKPTFVLPRSPSPKHTEDDIPAPFSPSSKSLHRRGKNRSGLMGYVPGGMAAEVRSWILETGSRHEQVGSNQSLDMSSRQSAELHCFLVAARVLEVRPAVLSGSGALSFIRAEKVAVLSNEDTLNNEYFNIVLMGPPRSKKRVVQPPSRDGESSDTISPGDLLGVQRGLSWYVTLAEYQALYAASGVLDPMAQVRRPTESEEWLVSMQWELVQRAT
ncbi:hypothetical protein PDE_01722 [Penicillium oxalicum 114-2]|uniref:Uncharacterized protein n=1 Tax=Penicillium oxalicum (strain 114-2 / CGMCC 5302) TaxID=933388 RepID=S8ALP5_PENO1|nr:hypothetical protein PDE_01722 [Penicillium oxalicum 114-2]